VKYTLTITVLKLSSCLYNCTWTLIVDK